MLAAKLDMWNSRLDMILFYNYYLPCFWSVGCAASAPLNCKRVWLKTCVDFMFIPMKEKNNLKIQVVLHDRQTVVFRGFFYICLLLQ